MCIRDRSQRGIDHGQGGLHPPNFCQHCALGSNALLNASPPARGISSRIESIHRAEAKPSIQLLYLGCPLRLPIAFNSQIQSSQPPCQRQTTRWAIKFNNLFEKPPELSSTHFE